MEDFTEKRFGYLRVLSKDEKLQMIQELEEDIEVLQRIIQDKNASSEQVSESYSDIAFDESKLNYLRNILEEPQL